MNDLDDALEAVRSALLLCTSAETLEGARKAELERRLEKAAEDLKAVIVFLRAAARAEGNVQQPAFERPGSERTTRKSPLS
jgi:SpoU rRNA methylase family enzyme